jgi:type II secretory pathway pseudopilin PulG
VASKVNNNSRNEEGFALLFVLVLAAIVAITLYNAMPDAYFEAQRQKEQLLIDRGNEYKTAIKRFVTKNGRFPTAISQLDNFNNVRYLRHHYKDPMTGKDEWRLVHVMGPGFILTDSKVTPFKEGAANQAAAVIAEANGLNKTTNPSAKNSAAATSSGGGFGTSTDSFWGSSGFGKNGAFSEDSFDATANNPDGAAKSAADLYGAKRRPPAAPASEAPGADEAKTADAEKPLTGPPPPRTQLPPDAPDSVKAEAAANQSGQPPAPGPDASNAANDNPAASALHAVNSALRQQQAVPASSFGRPGTGPTISTGAIAGVASKAKGSSIKEVDKQTDYSKWEFVYNPQEDAAKKMQGALGGNRTNPNSQNQNPSGGFGMTPNNTSSSAPTSSQ